MVNQILFGESFEILDEHKNWQLIRIAHDQYEGWVDKSHPFGISFKNRPEKCYLQTGIDGSISYDMGKNWLPLSPGMLLPNYYNGLLKWGTLTLLHKGTSEPANNNINASKADFTLLTEPWLNVPYLWGGRTMSGTDCSGFVQMVFRIYGFNLPRDTSQQVKIGNPVYFVQESRPGDLAFFTDTINDRKLSHVGIFLSPSTVIHASGIVKISTIDQIGLYNDENSGYTHYLKAIQRTI